jgi:hypothetical protein
LDIPPSVVNTLPVLFKQAVVLPISVGTGRALITTDVVEEALQPLALVTVKTYVPVAATVTLLIDGFCAVEVNPFGPVQLYELAAVEVRLRVEPAQTGVLLFGVAVGKLFTVSVLEHTLLQPLASVTVTV